MSEHDELDHGPMYCMGRNCGTTTAQHSPECILETAIIQGWSTDDTLAAAKAVFDARAPLSPAHIEDGEEVEVVAWADPSDLNLMRRHGHTSCVVKAAQDPCCNEPLMTVAQHQRIVAARSAPHEQAELWAVHVEGPDDLYAAFSREDAERHASELNAIQIPELGVSISAVVIPSPWGAVEHWQYMAEQEREHVESMRAALSAPPAAGWTRAEQHDDISGDFEGYCWIDGRTGQRHWLPHGMNPNEKEPTRTNGGPRRCLFAPEGWACIKQAQHEGPCMAVKLTEGECHATSPAAGVPGDSYLESCAAAAKMFEQLAPTPPASEQQRAVVMPERKRSWYCMGEKPMSAEDEAYNAC
ncbi:hypothetical protein, partial [Metapseudomonas otitidis]|uniref:hypothetical protein n=1 Tax=Metapseudomonas otitidis TaxID=319939 RepID=UPI00244A8B3C